MNGSFKAQEFPQYPFKLAAELVRTNKPDVDKVRELVTITRLLHDRYQSLAAEVNELRRDKANLENTVRLLSIEDIDEVEPQE